MSLSNNGPKDFESLYNNLKEEYEQNKKDNEEICVEYESTIQILTDSVESFKKENKELLTKLSKIENEQKTFMREKENLIKKNKDKQIDIQCLNEQNDKLNELIKKLKEDKSIFDTKIVNYENDIDHYQNKIREYEDFIDELKSQLEEALEENITLQTEFETFKLNTGDQLLRKDEELRDIKNDINNKEKIIQKLSKKPSELFNIQKLQKKLIKDKKFMKYQRRHTLAENKGDFDFIKLASNLNGIIEKENENDKDDNDKHDKIKTYKKLKTIFEENNKKTLTTCKTSQDNIDSNGKDYTNNNINSSSKNVSKILSLNRDNKNSNEDKGKLDITSHKNNNEKLNSNENEIRGISSIIKRQFGDLVICEENKIYVNPLVQKLLNKEQIKEFTISLKNMLIRIKQRKNNLNDYKKAINEKLEKIGFRAK